MQGWLPLNEFSTKYNMSISTLRRRIRNSEVEFQFRDGKYWLKDEGIPRGYKTNRPIEPISAKTELPKSDANVTQYNLLEQFKDTKPLVPAADHSTNQALEVADRLVAELKAAYVLILHEKEEMILQLKEEAADLRTLSRILESENERLKKEVADAVAAAEAHAKLTSVDFTSSEGGSAMDRWLDEP